MRMMLTDEARLDQIEATIRVIEAVGRETFDLLVEGFANGGAAGELRRRRAVDRIRHSFFHPVPGGLRPIPHPAYLGLGQWRTPQSFGRPRGFPSAPWGWRWLKEEDRNAAICLPLWLYWPAYLRRYWRSYVYEPLIRGGWWTVREGDYYWEGHLSAPRWLRSPVWCFLNDRDHYEAAR